MAKYMLFETIIKTAGTLVENMRSTYSTSEEIDEALKVFENYIESSKDELEDLKGFDAVKKQADDLMSLEIEDEALAKRRDEVVSKLRNIYKKGSDTACEDCNCKDDKLHESSKSGKAHMNEATFIAGTGSDPLKWGNVEKTKADINNLDNWVSGLYK